MEITFLGTASHMPTAKRNHTGILVTLSAENILIDCGEGIQRQFRIANLNPCKLTHLLITHWHGDHTLGIAGLLQTLAMSEYQKKLKIFGPKGTKEKFQLLEKLYGKLKINYEIKEISSGIISKEKDFEIESKPMDHNAPSNAYSISIKEKLRLDKSKLKKLKLPNSPIIKNLQEGKDIVHNGKKIKSRDVTYLQKGKKLTIIMDTSPNQNAIAIAKNSDVLICESSFLSTEEQKANEYKHMTAKAAAEIAKKSNSKKLILTHISQRYKNESKPLVEEAQKIFKNVLTPKDFDKVSV
jgi:ribonuclease Z